MRNVYTIKPYSYTIEKLSKTIEFIHIKIFKTKVSLQNNIPRSGFSSINFLKEFTKLQKKKNPFSIEFILFLQENEREIHNFGPS